MKVGQSQKPTKNQFIGIILTTVSVLSMLGYFVPKSFEHPQKVPVHSVNWSMPGHSDPCSTHGDVVSAEKTYDTETNLGSSYNVTCTDGVVVEVMR